MFDVGFWELTIIGVIALLVLGPERLPRTARTVGLWVGKARRTLSEVKRDIDRELDAAELKDLQKVKEELQDTKTEFEDAAKTLNESAVDDEDLSIMPDAKVKETPAAETPTKSSKKEEPDPPLAETKTASS